MRQAWPRVRFVNLEADATEKLLYGTNLQVTADLFLDGITSTDVLLEIYHGDVDHARTIVRGKTVAMACTKELPDNVYRFEGAIPCDKTGEQGFMVRVIPHHEDLANKHETGLINWA